MPPAPATCSHETFGSDQLGLLLNFKPWFWDVQFPQPTDPCETKKTALLSMKYCLLNRDLYDNPCISGYMIQPPILYTLNFLIAHFKDQPSNKTLFASLILWDLDTWGHGVSKKEPLDRRFVNLTRLWREMCKLYLVIQSYVHVCLGYDQPNHRQLMST